MRAGSGNGDNILETNIRHRTFLRQWASVAGLCFATLQHVGKVDDEGKPRETLLTKHTKECRPRTIDHVFSDAWIAYHVRVKESRRN